MPLTPPFIAHENVRAIPALSQKTFHDNANAGVPTTYVWEYDLAARVTDPNQFLSTAPAPFGSNTIDGGGAGPQITPQPAIGPFADWIVMITGVDGAVVGGFSISYAIDAQPCSYVISIYSTTIIANQPYNASGLRVTARFVRFSLTKFAAGVIVNAGYYIRST